MAPKMATVKVRRPAMLLVIERGLSSIGNGTRLACRTGCMWRRDRDCDLFQLLSVTRARGGDEIMKRIEVRKAGVGRPLSCDSRGVRGCCVMMSHEATWSPLSASRRASFTLDMICV